MLPLSAVSLLPVAPCGLPLALGCRRLWRLGYRSTAWTAGIVLGVVTVAASLVAGLLGPIAIAIYAVILSLPVWAAGWWLNRRPIVWSLLHCACGQSGPGLPVHSEPGVEPVAESLCVLESQGDEGGGDAPAHPVDDEPYLLRLVPRDRRPGRRRSRGSWIACAQSWIDLP